MAKIKLRIADRNDIFLYMTRIENLFINEFLPDAPGDYVKIYLFALMHAQYEQEIDSTIMARTLKLEEFEVREAWDYWAAKGLVKKSKDGESIEFIRMVELFYGKTGRSDAPGDEQSKASDRIVIDTEMQAVYEKFQEAAGRPVSRRETEKLKDAVKLYDINSDVLIYAIEYCADINNYSPDYIFKVALRWKEEGCEDVDSVKELLEKHSERNKAYREIFKEIGFSRLTTPADREIMDSWFDEKGFSLEEVLEACRATGGIREPSLRYVNKILENKILEKGGVNTHKSAASHGADKGEAGEGSKVSRKVLREYYEHIREQDDKEHAEKIRKAISEIPGMEEVFSKENALSTAVTDFAPGEGSRKRSEQMREERRSLEAAKRKLLANEGLPEDYLERKYRCELCKDTGYTDEGKVCSCCRARADEAYMWVTEK